MARDGSEWRRVVSSDAPESPTFVGNRTVPVRRLVLFSGGVWSFCLDESRCTELSPPRTRLGPFDDRRACRVPLRAWLIILLVH